MIADSLVTDTITDTLIANPLSWETIINAQHNLAVSQYNLAMYGITALLGLVAVALGLNWWSAKRENTIKKLKDDFKTMENRIKTMEDRVKKDVDEKLGNVSKKLGNVDTKIQLMDKKMAKFDAQKARLFALGAQQAKVFSVAAHWWAIAIINYTNPKVDDKEFTRISVDAVIDSLKECIDKNIELEDEDRKTIEAALSCISGTLDKEKKEIEDLLKKLPKK